MRINDILSNTISEETEARPLSAGGTLAADQAARRAQQERERASSSLNNAMGNMVRSGSTADSGGNTGEPAALANPTTSPDNPAVASGASTPAPTSNTSVPAGAQGPTGDPTLDQPLPPGAPKRTFAQTVGGISKAVGAVGGGIAGIGRAVKKGYAAGADAVGGPGAAPSTSSGFTQPTGATAGGASSPDELAQLKSTLQAMDQRMRRAGF